VLAARVAVPGSGITRLTKELLVSIVVFDAVLRNSAEIDKQIFFAMLHLSSK
jgi:hypothetical protein